MGLKKNLRRKRKTFWIHKPIPHADVLLVKPKTLFQIMTIMKKTTAAYSVDRVPHSIKFIEFSLTHDIIQHKNKLALYSSDLGNGSYYRSYTS